MSLSLKVFLMESIYPVASIELRLTLVVASIELRLTLVVASIELRLTLVEPQQVQWVRVPAQDSHNTLLNHKRAEVATCHQVPVRYCKLAAMVYYMPAARHFF